MGGMASRKAWRCGLAAGLALAAVALAGCGQSSPSRSAGTTTGTTTGPTEPAPTVSVPQATTAPAPTSPPTTVWKPTAPQATADAAAAALVQAWAGGDRAGAGAVATPDAVATLFAVPYPGPGLAISRGCSSAFPPIVCTYGPPGGAAPTDAIYEILVSQAPAGWYVSSVRVLG